MQWQLQAQNMVANGALPKAHFQRAQTLQSFTAANLKECMWLRDRLGWQTSFVEDPMLQGMLAARSSKGIASKIRQEAVSEARAAADKAKKEGKQADAVRELIGPRGGLPSLKSDLQKLASLVQVEYNEKTTVEQLKAAIRPVVKLIASKDPPSAKSSSASSHQEPPKGLTTASTRAPETPALAAPSTPGMTAASSPMPGVKLQDIHDLLAQQDQKFQSMLTQVMGHMMSLQGNQVPVNLQTQGAMRFDMAQDDAVMDGTAHGWSQEEIQGALYTEEELRQLNWQVQSDLKQEEADLLRGPFFGNTSG